MSPTPEPVRQTRRLSGVRPSDVYDVVVDFPAYPRLFKELASARVLSTEGARVRVEFKAQMVLPVRYVLDLVCNRETLTIDWTFVEGEVVANSTGGWRFTADGDGTLVDYRAALDIKAPLPGFVIRKITDGLVALSLPAMFAALEREVRDRRASSP